MRRNVPEAGGRLDWLDYAKAIGIALVVLGHVNSGIARTPGLTMGDDLKLLNEVIYSFHMPLFFLLAGIASQLKAPPAFNGFLRGLVWSVAVPYLLWSVLWIGLKASMPGVTDNPVGYARIGEILWAPIEHMWFLYHLFFIRLGWYALERLGSRQLLWAATAAAAAGSILCSHLGPAWFAPSFVLLNIAFYGFGLAFWTLLPSLNNRMVAAVLAATGLAAWFGLSAAADVAGPLLALALATAGAGAAIALAKALPPRSAPGMPIVSFIGEASLAIYVMHLFVTTATRKALALAGLLSEGSVLVIATIAGIVIPAAIYWVATRLTSLTGLPMTLIAGLGPHRKRLSVKAGIVSAPIPRLPIRARQT